MTTPKLSRRAALVTGASALLLPGQVWSQSSQRDVEGGIGGTGIVGLLTDFGSLIVGGAYLQTHAGTRYTDGFGTLQKADLYVGDSLTVEASGPKANLTAQRVHITHPLVGRISQVNSGGRVIVVNGVEVRLDTRLRGFSVGDRVAVSGIWRGQIVQASRLSPARANLDLVSGDVGRSRGARRIGSVAVVGGGIGQPATGSFATAIGQYSDETGQLRAQQVKRDRFTGAAGPLVWLSVEGYLTPSSERPGYRVAGLGHSFARNLNLSAFSQNRVLFNGPYTGAFAASDAVVLPEGFAAQRRVLRRISSQTR